MPEKIAPQTMNNITTPNDDNSVPTLPPIVVRPPAFRGNILSESRPPGVYQSEIRLIGKDGDYVVFRNTPEVTENGQVMYFTKDDIFGPSSFMYWTGSPSRNFSINHKMVSRTVAEATENYTFLSLLRGWRMPKSSGLGQDPIEMAPEVLRLWGYDNGQYEGQFMGIPVVIINVDFSFPVDVDYISTSNGAKLPIVMPVNISLKEAHTIEDMEGFDYESYKGGVLPEWT